MGQNRWRGGPVLAVDNNNNIRFVAVVVLSLSTIRSVPPPRPPFKGSHPQPIKYTQTLPIGCKIDPETEGGGPRRRPGANPMHVKLTKKYIYIYYKCTYIFLVTQRQSNSAYDTRYAELDKANTRL